LNLFNLEEEEIVEEEVNDDEFEDCHFEEVNAQESDQVIFRKLFVKRYHQIPDFSRLSRKPPAETIDYLILSNLCSFLLISRYYNGLILETEPEILVANLITQLLSEDS